MTNSSESAPVFHKWASGLRYLLLLGLALLSLLPIANWIAGGHEAPWYDVTLSEWLSGSAIAVGLGVVLAIASRRTGLWRDGLVTGFTEGTSSRPGKTAFVLGLTSLATYTIIASAVFDRRPLLIDELVQVMQSRIFASGRLSLPAPTHPEFYSILHVVDFGGRWYSQFPPGGPLMLTLGSLVGMPWLVGPVCGAASVVGFWFLMPYLDERPTVRLGATLLFAFAPFMAFTSASHMNSVPTLLFGVTALLSVAAWRGRRDSAPWLAAAAGLSLGLMASIRPVDGAAYAAPIGALMLLTCLGNWRRTTDLIVAAAGVAAPMAFVLFFNSRTTGDPLLFGYELLWGKSHALGFHRAPWGFAHTPARGLELINLYLLRLQTYLFETPIPSLVPALGAAFLAKRVATMDRVLLAASALLLLGYFAYWHDGFYLGPRFLFPLMPLLAVWSARFLPEIGRVSRGQGLLYRSAVLSFCAAMLMSAGFSLPVRVRQYQGGLASMRLDYTRPADVQGISNALILVRESWGTQLVARLWALGVPRTETEGLYRGVDTCVLEHAVTRMEQSGLRDTTAMQALLPLLRDSSRVVKTDLSPDRTERMIPGATYSPLCVRRLEEDRQGFTLLAPLHVLDTGSNVYVRDLHARDSLVLSEYRGRPVFLLRPRSLQIGAPLELSPVSVDSLRRVWADERALETGSPE